MNTWKQTDIERLKDIIDSVKVANDSNAMFIVYSENHAKMLKDIMPEVKTFCLNKPFDAKDFDIYDKVYIIPYKEEGGIKW